MTKTGKTVIATIAALNILLAAILGEWTGVGGWFAAFVFMVSDIDN